MAIKVIFLTATCNLRWRQRSNFGATIFMPRIDNDCLVAAYNCGAAIERLNWNLIGAGLESLASVDWAS